MTSSIGSSPDAFLGFRCSSSSAKPFLGFSVCSLLPTLLGPSWSSSWLHISRPAHGIFCALDVRAMGDLILHCFSSDDRVIEFAKPFAHSSDDDAFVPIVGSQDALGPIIDPRTDLQSISEWELDYFSRPILDDKGKRMWELVVCDTAGTLQFARFYPNTTVNSVDLNDAILYILRSTGLPKPQKIRFFRSEVQPLISKVCDQLDIQPVPSRRCISLMRWLNERYDSIYQKHPGFQVDAMRPSPLEQSFPLEISDSLRGEQWAFVQLPLQGVLGEVAEVEKGSTFGSCFSLRTLGIDLPNNAVIPGLAVASTRATPLAAWTNTLELASLDVDRKRGCVILSTGISDRWLYAFYRRSRDADREAAAWLAAKKACHGFHFLAVQKALDADVCTGFWLLFDQPLPPV